MARQRPCPSVDPPPLPAAADILVSERAASQFLRSDESLLAVADRSQQDATTWELDERGGEIRRGTSDTPVVGRVFWPPLLAVTGRTETLP